MLYVAPLLGLLFEITEGTAVTRSMTQDPQNPEQCQIKMCHFLNFFKEASHSFHLVFFCSIVHRKQDAELVKVTGNKSHGELGLGGYSPEDDLVIYTALESQCRQDKI